MRDTSRNSGEPTSATSVRERALSRSAAPPARPPGDGTGSQRTRFAGARALLQFPIVFVIPYLVFFVLLVLYPVGYGLYLGRNPSDYLTLFADSNYRQAVWNTLVYLAVGVNVKLFLALLLSGFFASPKRRWPKVLLLVFLLPWAVPALPGFMSIHWMFNTDYGLVNSILGALELGDSRAWLIEYESAFGIIIGAYVWKSLPFWTVLLFAARMAIPKDIYEAAAVDGCVGVKRFLYISFPLLRNVYVTSTLLSTIWTLGDYNAVRFITNGGPFNSTQVLATLGVNYAFLGGDVSQGVAIVLTAIPLIIPLVALLVHRLKKD
ncbi:carbohydrate ABC transporter permease [Pseudonocardia sichuanensis]